MNTLSPQTGVGWPSVVVPVDGEEIVASSTDPVPAGEGPVTPAFQALTDRDEWLKWFVDNYKPRRPYLGCQDGSILLLGPTDPYVFGDGTRITRSTATSFQAATYLEGGGSLANSTWYYLYVRVFNNAVNYEVSTTEPDAALHYKSGDTSRCYAGPFRTDGSGSILPFHSVGGDWRYVENATVVLSSGSATSWTDVDCSAYVPPTARMGHFSALMGNAASTNRFAYLRPKGTSVTYGRQLAGPGTSGINSSDSFSYGLPSTLTLQYKVDNASLSVTLAMDGFTEGR